MGTEPLIRIAGLVEGDRGFPSSWKPFGMGIFSGVGAEVLIGYDDTGSVDIVTKG